MESSFFCFLTRFTYKVTGGARGSSDTVLSLLDAYDSDGVSSSWLWCWISLVLTAKGLLSISWRGSFSKADLKPSADSLTIVLIWLE